ncbi:MAG: ABC transporter ATP-binding protein, partial [Cyanobacteria bacterium J06643_5]
LAFAVAAHLEPEILVVDEVLAVGDAQFQKKCLGKMEDVGREGRTVIFVSHNMTAIQTLCNEAISLDKGKLIRQGEVSQQIYNYLNNTKTGKENLNKNRVKFGENLILNEFSAKPQTLISGKKLNITLRFSSLQKTYLSDLSLLLYSSMGIRIGIVDLRSSDIQHLILPEVYYNINIVIKNLKLVEGEYRLGIFLANEDIRKELLDLVDFSVISDSSIYKVAPYPREHRGFLELDFDITDIESQDKSEYKGKVLF